MNEKDDEVYHTAWCTQQLNLLNEGGIWAVRRSGLIFQRQGDDFVLITQMPHKVEGMEAPISAEELAEIQENDFQLIRRKFAIAGITVRKKEEKP